jgi:hypothetical protein
MICVNALGPAGGGGAAGAAPGGVKTRVAPSGCVPLAAGGEPEPNHVPIPWFGCGVGGVFAGAGAPSFSSLAGAGGAVEAPEVLPKNCVKAPGLVGAGCPAAPKGLFDSLKGPGESGSAAFAGELKSLVNAPASLDDDDGDDDGVGAGGGVAGLAAKPLNICVNSPGPGLEAGSWAALLSRNGKLNALANSWVKAPEAAGGEAGEGSLLCSGAAGFPGLAAR